MVKAYTHAHTYDYPFPTVALAFFLRYPNPYSRHVLGADVLDRRVDPATGRLHTTRLLLKRSRLPAAVRALIPRSLLSGPAAQAGAGEGGATAAAAAGGPAPLAQTYVLETTVVDVRGGWMRAELRNLEMTRVLAVEERHLFRRVDPPPPSSSPPAGPAERDPERTAVATTVTLRSRLGQRLLSRSGAGAAASPAASEEPRAPTTTGEWLRSWGQTRLQRSIEAVGLRRTSASQPNAMAGMHVVLERLRRGGLVAVFEGMRSDRLLAAGPEAPKD
jgi:4-amino-4-deoxychorismate lyase